MNEQQKIEQAYVLTGGIGWDCYRFALHIEGADTGALHARTNKLNGV